jgi:hypothetical protein
MEKKGPEEKLRAYIRNFAEILEGNPYLPRIMMREFASGGHHFPDILAKDMLNILGILLGVLEEGVEEGVLIEANPFIVQMMIVGIMIFYKTTAPLRRKYGLLHKEISAVDQKHPGAGEQEIENLVLRALSK